MPNTFDSVPQSITQRAMAQNFSMEEKTRREAMLKNKDFYYAQSEKHLDLLNEDQDPLILNLTKPVVHKRSTLLYKRPLVREFEGPEVSKTFIELVYEENKIDRFLLAVDLAAELTGTAMILPESTDAEGYDMGIKLRLFDAVDISVVPDDDDPSLPAAVSIIRFLDRLSARSTPKNPQVERVIRQQIWTDEDVVTYDGHMIVSSETNNLGFLPFTTFRGEDVYNQFLGHSPTNIIRLLNEDVNQMLTHLGYMIKMQSATPIALVGYQSGEGVVIHPGRAFSVPAGASADVLQLNPKITEVLATIQYLEEKLFETSNIPKVSVVGGEGESGRELMVRWFPLLQLFEEKTVRYEGYELDLANMILKVRGLPPLEKVVVHWPKEEVLPLSASEDTLMQDIQLNIKTAIDEVMRLNPELTETEAEAEVRANAEFNLSLKKQAMEALQPEEEDTREQEDGEEDNELREQGEQPPKSEDGTEEK